MSTTYPAYNDLVHLAQARSLTLYQPLNSFNQLLRHSEEILLPKTPLLNSHGPNEEVNQRPIRNRGHQGNAKVAPLLVRLGTQCRKSFVSIRVGTIGTGAVAEGAHVAHTRGLDEVLWARLAGFSGCSIMERRLSLRGMDGAFFRVAGSTSQPPACWLI